MINLCTKIKNFWFVCFVFVLVGCGKSGPEQLIGSYESNTSYGTDELLLKADGTYEQTIRIRGDPKPILSSGKWSYHDDFPTSSVDLESLLLITDKDGNLLKDYRAAKTGLAVLPVERNFLLGHIRLGNDDSHPYNKKSS